MKLICVLPYCSSDHASATRLLEWIRELDPRVEHHLLLVADNAVPLDTKKALDALGKSVFSSAETIMPQCPAAVNGNYHPAAAQMFSKTMGHINKCHKWPFLWMEPDCVPLKSGWLDMLATAYENNPHRFLGTIVEPKPNGLPENMALPKKMLFATAIYPPNCYEELKGFCDGKKAFDVAFSDYLVPMSDNSPFFQHVWGAPDDPPTFKAVKEPTDGKNVGTMASLRPEAVLWHRNKDGSLIDLLMKNKPHWVAVAEHPKTDFTDLLNTQATFKEEPSLILNPPIKRGPGRPPKQTVESETL